MKVQDLLQGEMQGDVRRLVRSKKFKKLVKALKTGKACFMSGEAIVTVLNALFDQGYINNINNFYIGFNTRYSQTFWKDKYFLRLTNVAYLKDGRSRVFKRLPDYMQAGIAGLMAA